MDKGTAPEGKSAMLGASQETPEPAEESRRRGALTIVGVGASAGGLEAFSDFLAALPLDTRMAFVLVQHLDPHHESILPELLSHRTRLPVAHVKDETAVEPDHVYVIPPNTTMVLSDGLLRLSPRTRDEHHQPVDAFLESLADQQGANSIGVILSGSASDGAVGLKKIKSAGGITFCQDESARFDGMPRSAVAVGAVDFILPPGKIASEIATIASHPYYVRGDLYELAQRGPELEKIINLIRNKSGVDFAQYRKPTIQRRLLRRLAMRGCETLERYLAILEHEPDELSALFDDLLINVTEFFRDPEVFNALKEKAFPALVRDRKPNESIRIWVPGCSSGEEVYSLAITLIEYLEQSGLHFPIQLFGTDVSERIVEKARAGIYPASIVASFSPERLRRFFLRIDSGFQISRAVRELCIFSQQNLTKDPPLSRMDLISCRNLLIYLTNPLQRRVINTFGYALQPAGCLLLGTSESLGTMSESFDVVDPQNKIFCRKPNVPRAAFELYSSINPTEPYSRSLLAPLLAVGAPERAATVQNLVDRVLLARFRPTAVVIDQAGKIVELRGDAKRYLAQPPLGRNGDLYASILPEMGPVVMQGVQSAKERGRKVELDSIRVKTHERTIEVSLTVIPLTQHERERFFIILFEEPSGATNDGNHLPEPIRGESPGVSGSQFEKLERELISTREYLQAIIEELRSTNEEAQSTNEELQSTNEELQTAKEELQSSNEELHTVNAEMQSRNSELAELNSDLLNLLSSMSMPVVMVGNDLRIRRFTPTAETVLRLIPTDVGRSILDLQPRVKIPDLERVLRQVIDSLNVHEEEVQDQEGNWYLLRVRPYRTTDHRIEGAVLQLLDIGELKRSLLDARLARDYAQAIVDTVREPLAVFDESLVLQNGNQAFFSYFHIARGDVFGRNVREIPTPPFNNPKLMETIERVMQSTPYLRDLEIELEISGMGQRALVLNGRQMPALGNKKLILLAIEDVTDRKQAAEARYRRLFESSKDGILLVDAKSGEVADINPAVEQLFGLIRQDVIGRVLTEVPRLRDFAMNQAAMDRVRQEGLVRFPDVSLESNEGRILNFEIIGNTYLEGRRSVVQFNLRDMTERLKFDRELQHTAKLESLGLLAGGIAHDFNNLLTGVLGNANLIYSDTPAGHPNRTFAREIIHSAERAAHLTRQMLAYAGKGRFIVERVNVPDLIQDILALIQTSIPKTVEVVLDLAEDTPEVEADPGQLQQLIMNLVINGAEAVGEHRPGRVEVRTSCVDVTAQDIEAKRPGYPAVAGRYTAIEVKDTGVGMDESTKSRIFDPFFTTKFTGRGLGLAAVQGIIRAHGGALGVFSNPGEGALFRVFLPGIPAEPHAAKSRVERPRNKNHGTILVIDDEETVRKVASISLQRAGFTVLLAENGQAGIDLLRVHKDEITLILLDLLMPMMNGEETLDHIREIDRDIPIVLMSGFDESEVHRRYANRQFSAFVQKPYSSNQLLETVTSVLLAENY